MAASAQEFAIHDHHGRQIGSVRIERLGRNRREFWKALALDGCDLGAHVSRIEAEEAIQDDWDAGRPRDSSSPEHRWRPIFDVNPPVYLGR